MPALGEAAAACVDEVYRGRGCLIGRRSVEKLRTLASTLPRALSWAGFECRLRDGDDRTDFGVSAEAADAPGMLIDGSEALCQRTLRAWLDEPDLRALIPRAIVEFDTPDGDASGDAARNPWDSAFAFFRVGMRGGPEAADRLRWLLAALTSMQAKRLPGVDAIASALPRGSQILHVATLDHRGSSETRLHYALRSDDLPALCDEVAAARPAAARLLRALVAGLPIHRVAVQSSDVAGMFRPYSVEFDLPHDPSPTWRTLLERLVSAEVAAPAKAGALLDWSGQSTYELPSERARVRVQRGFNVTLCLGEQPSAKAYPYLHCCHADFSNGGPR